MLRQLGLCYQAILCKLQITNTEVISVLTVVIEDSADLATKYNALQKFFRKDKYSIHRHEHTEKRNER